MAVGGTFQVIGTARAEVRRRNYTGYICDQEPQKPLSRAEWTRGSMQAHSDPMGGRIADRTETEGNKGMKGFAHP